MTACLRRAQLEDRHALSRLGEQTFRESFIEDFAIPYPEHDLAVFVPQTYSAQAFAETVSDARYASWIAEWDGEAVGYAVAGPCSLPYAEAEAGHGELKRLYVRRSAQGTGLGRRLMDDALEWLERDGPRPIWIGVWSGNLRAQRFYARYRFEKFGEHEFPVGGWRDQEFALRRG